MQIYEAGKLNKLRKPCLGAELNYLTVVVENFFVVVLLRVF